MSGDNVAGKCVDAMLGKMAEQFAPKKAAKVTKVKEVAEPTKDDWRRASVMAKAKAKAKAKGKQKAAAIEVPDVNLSKFPGTRKADVKLFRMPPPYLSNFMP